ncbi:hypothetical protein [Streptomyces sp. W4I9-2]|uniref:hypothetical protein n=1 Tax=Streptomyces sp. W4I9-2 TaxID=3042297 RepID=UPI0027856010|nr:hypothetical protein [Streptomyces sp. W4I9-2]MDQ0693636.1 hypothetical protein [Streptomyces sp. W4I9-2]
MARDEPVTGRTEAGADDAPHHALDPLGRDGGVELAVLLPSPDLRDEDLVDRAATEASAREGPSPLSRRTGNPESDGACLTLAEVLGRPGRSYAQWARDHAFDFSKPAD